MSYEHCDAHDEDATNGCESCYREDVAEHRRSIIALLRRVRTQSAEELFDELDAKFAEIAHERFSQTGSYWPDKKRESGPGDVTEILKGLECAHAAISECHPDCGHLRCPDCGLEWDEEAGK